MRETGRRWREKEVREGRKLERRLLVLYSLPRRQKQQRRLCEIFLQTALYLKVRVGFHPVPLASRLHQGDTARGLHVVFQSQDTAARHPPASRLYSAALLYSLFTERTLHTRENVASEYEWRGYTHGVVKGVDVQDKWNGCNTIEVRV